MSGFDLPPIGFDQLYKQGPFSGLREMESPQEGAARLVGDHSGAEEVGENGSFENNLTRSLQAVRSLQEDVNHKYEGLMLGRDVELHDVMAAANKSEVTFNLMLEVRNKLLEAWQKLSRSAV